MGDLANLLERVEKAEGWEGDLIDQVLLACVPLNEGGGFHRAFYALSPTDAALALVERKLPGWTWRLDSPDSASEPAFARLSGTERRSAVGWAKTPALAVLAALLRALIAQEAAAAPTARSSPSPRCSHG